MTIRGLLAATFRTYKRAVSPCLPPACRFYPTCSEYAAQAVEVHGALKGSALAVGRLMRCHYGPPYFFEFRWRYSIGL